MAQAPVFLQNIIVGGPSHESSRRTFHCPRGHGYVADVPVTITAYGITPAPFKLCPACLVQLLVETCGAVEDAPAPPPVITSPVIAPTTLLPADYKGPAPMTFQELLAARARAQGKTEPVLIPAPQGNPVPGGTASDAPESLAGELVETDWEVSDDGGRTWTPAAGPDETGMRSSRKRHRGA